MLYVHVLVCVFLKSACGHGRTSGWPPQPEVSIPAVQGGEELLVKLQERRLGLGAWVLPLDFPMGFPMVFPFSHGFS